MNTKSTIQHFNDDLNKIQNHQPTVTDRSSLDYTQELKIANRLLTFSSASVSQNRLVLKQRLIEKIRTKKRISPERPRFSFVSALSLCLILTILSLAIPPVRTFAQNIIQSIGNFLFVDQPTDAENYVATVQNGIPTPTPNPTIVAKITPQFYETKLLSVEDASAKAGYQVYLIDYIPEGYILTTRDVLFTGQTVTADTSYRMELDPPINNGFQFSGIIALEQTQTNEDTDPWIMRLGDIPVVEVNLRGTKGGWIEQIPIYPFQTENSEWDYARWNQLIWAENGYTFVLQTNMPADTLPLEELLKIAESVSPY